MPWWLSPEAGPFAATGAALVAIGLYGLIARAHLIRKIIAFNILGSGVFLVFGAVAARPEGPTDPVPQAMIVTGLVVALASTALAVAATLRLFVETGATTLPGRDDG